MLFCAAQVSRVTHKRHLHRRKAMEQFSLDLFDTDNPHAHLWEGLAEPQQVVVLEILARMIGKAVQGDAQRAEGPSDE
jgi:hypothetical protein